MSPHHLHGGDLVWQIGTGYFGCRDAKGRFELARFRDVVDAHPQIRMIEIKLSQGAKPGLGGLLPGAKVTPEVAALRGIPEGVDCRSPNRHTEFDAADGLLDFVEMLAAESGRPVGIKSAVGHACGVLHPALVTLDHLGFVDDRFGARDATEVFGYESGWGRPGAFDCREIDRLMMARNRAS